MKRKAAALILAVLLCLCSAVARADSPGVLRVLAQGDDPAASWSGTAFAVGIQGEDSQIFLTNRHVALGKGDCDEVTLWLLRGDEKIPCSLLAASDGYPDVAVIRAEEPIPGCPALALMSSRQVRNGTAVCSLGYSGTGEFLQSQGTVTESLRMAKAGLTRCLIHTAAIDHGCSGGPLLNEDGVVVGLNTYGLIEEDRFCAVYTDYAMDMLEDLGIEFTQTPGPGIIPTAVSNLLRLPNLPDPVGYGIFAAGVGLVIWLLFPPKKRKNHFN